jgi:hypothetical protein
MGSKSLETPHKDYKKVMLKIQPTCSHTANDLARAMKLPDLFSVISADLQPSVKVTTALLFQSCIPRLTQSSFNLYSKDYRSMKNHCCLNLQKNGQEKAFDSLSDFGSLAFLQICSNLQR